LPSSPRHPSPHLHHHPSHQGPNSCNQADVPRHLSTPIAFHHQARFTLPAALATKGERTCVCCICKSAGEFSLVRRCFVTRRFRHGSPVHQAPFATPDIALSLRARDGRCNQACVCNTGRTLDEFAWRIRPAILDGTQLKMARPPSCNCSGIARAHSRSHARPQPNPSCTSPSLAQVACPYE